MKKLIAISFLLLLCFNILGYRYAFMFLANKADSRLESQIDNSEYDESELVEIRVDLNIPYQERYTDFERHYGEITIDGKPYTYVMRKMEGTILILKCIRNNSKEQLRNTSNEITKANSSQDQNTTSQKQNVPLIKIIKSDYFNNSGFVQLNFDTDIAKTNQLPPLKRLPEIFIKPLHQPPCC